MADEELRILFAKRLNHFLQLNGYSQADMARHMKVSTATAAKWCTGQTIPRIDKIQSLANWFGVDKSALLEESASSRPEYYFDKETAKAAQEIFENKELRMLFDATRDADAEDLRALHSMALALKRKERGSND